MEEAMVPQPRSLDERVAQEMGNLVFQLHATQHQLEVAQRDLALARMELAKRDAPAGANNVIDMEPSKAKRA